MLIPNSFLLFSRTNKNLSNYNFWFILGNIFVKVGQKSFALPLTYHFVKNNTNILTKGSSNYENSWPHWSYVFQTVCASKWFFWKNIFWKGSKYQCLQNEGHSRIEFQVMLVYVYKFFGYLVCGEWGSRVASRCLNMVM